MNQVHTIGKRLTPLQSFTLAVLRLIRWRVLGSFPAESQYIVLGAPHTSNWDFLYMLLIKGATGVNLRWVGKDSLFRWPFGGLMRWLGGIPVNRRLRTNFVDQIIELFQAYDRLVVGITPEGTRGKTSGWRSGFYYMALGARVPIQLVAIDYKSRLLEIGPLLIPCGDIEKDFSVISTFYASRKGKHPQEQGQVRLRQDSESL